VAEEMLYAAQKTRGKVRGALPRIPARRTPPENSAAFPFPFMFRNSVVHGVRPPRLNVR